MAGLTDINDRLTPSVPIEITFDAQPVAVGRKQTTIFGHVAATGGSGVPYQVYTVVNVADSAAAQAEVDALAGAGSQIGKMAKAFVDSSVLAGRVNFPAFRVVLIPNAVTDFGPSDEALTAVKTIRSDMFVSCYPASDSANEVKLQGLCAFVSGVDRDLQGQFGSFMTVGSIDDLVTQEAFGFNSRFVIVASLPDTNTALVNEAADTTTASKVLTNIASTAGINEGAQVSGTGIPVGAVVTKVEKTQVTISLAATATGSAVALAFQNVISQSAEIVAAAHAAGMMASAFPYNPLQGVTVGGLIPPKKKSDWIQIDPNGSSEQALIAGLSPLYVQPGNIVGFLRTRTTYALRPDNVTAVTAYFDWQDLVVLNDFREVCYQVSQNPPFNNNPGGTKASRQVAALFKDEVLRQAYNFQTLGAFQAVKELAPQFQVATSTTSRGRFDFKIPVNVLPGLYVIAGNILATTQFDQFTI